MFDLFLQWTADGLITNIKMSVDMILKNIEIWVEIMNHTQLSGSQ